ncbi:hypothetical protein MNV_1180030 [Candidatus Methanoperedens nitroreducens]|uniref:Uncharacterized protein n=1 Tax=Candidatus Methanoperedens nitratireducens TaxID=1392998 RepID=A0A284VJJ7_9EURY|nr:hypothetical protein MNV_1180030 [Candidatus Methanoperedens nitroreducens]
MRTMHKTYSAGTARARRALVVGGCDEERVRAACGECEEVVIYLTPPLY